MIKWQVTRENSSSDSLLTKIKFLIHPIAKCKKSVSYVAMFEMLNRCWMLKMWYVCTVGVDSMPFEIILSQMSVAR